MYSKILLLLFFLFCNDVLTVYSLSTTSTPSRHERCTTCHSTIQSSLRFPECDMGNIFSNMILANIYALQLNAYAYLHFNTLPHSNLGYYTPLNSLSNISVSMRSRHRYINPTTTSTTTVSEMYGIRIPFSTTTLRSRYRFGYDPYYDARTDPRRPSGMSVENYYRIRQYLDSYPPLRSRGRVYPAPLNIANVDRHRRRLPLVESNEIFDRYFGSTDYEDITSTTTTTTTLPTTDVPPENLIASSDNEFDAFNVDEYLNTFVDTSAIPCVIEQNDLDYLRDALPIPLNSSPPVRPTVPEFNGLHVIDMDDDNYSAGLGTIRSYYHDAIDALYSDSYNDGQRTKRESGRLVYCQCKYYDYLRFEKLVVDTPLLLNINHRTLIAVNKDKFNPRFTHTSFGNEPNLNINKMFNNSANNIVHLLSQYKHIEL